MSRGAADEGRRLVCFGVHAERLHRDEVWEVVDDVTSRLERAGCRLTFFVNPLGSQGTRRLAPRLAALVARGHEIGQHTHYYTSWDETLETVRKEASSDPAVFLRCLDRDHALLAEAGMHPAGFVSGAWTAHPEIFGWLRRNGFCYDCTSRTFPLRYESEMADPPLPAPDPFMREGGLLELPTTGGIRELLQREARGHVPDQQAPNGRHDAGGVLAYDLYYWHDTDLLDPRKRWVLRAMTPALCRYAAVGATVQEVAERARARLRPVG